MKKTILLIFILLLLFTSCQLEPSDQYTYGPPEKINDGIDVGSLGEVNIDSTVIKSRYNIFLKNLKRRSV